MENKYRSRKFIITLVGMSMGLGTALVGKLTPELSNIILAAIAAYNIANAWLGRKSE